MGQSPSSAALPEEWEPLLSNLKRDDIIQASKRVRITEDRTIYLDDEEFDLDEQVPVALAILTNFPHIKDVRFKLVPGRMTEEHFWGSLFSFLRETVEADRVIENIVGKLEVNVEEMCVTSNDNEDALQSSHDANDVASNGEKSVQDIQSFYLNELKAQEEHIHRLQRGLREANLRIRKLGLELHKERKKRIDDGVGSEDGTEYRGTNNDSLQHRDSISSMSSKRPHKGEWILHDDCKEFLKLDDHLKDNLRKEKKKRLDEVLTQMKFILDSDDLKDSYGKWSCCDSEDYSSEGCT